MHAVVTKTNVKEARRSARAVLHSTIMRPFNQVKCQQRVQMLSKYVYDRNSDIENAMEDINRDLWKRVLLNMSFNKDKASVIELQQEIDKYERGIKKKDNHHIGRKSKQYANHTGDGW